MWAQSWWSCSLILAAICSLFSQCLFRSLTSIGSMLFHTISTDSSSKEQRQTRTLDRCRETLSKGVGQTVNHQTHQTDSFLVGVFCPKPAPRSSSLVFLFMKKWSVITIHKTQRLDWKACLDAAFKEDNNDKESRGKGRHIDVKKESGGLFHTFLHTTALTDHESLWKKTEENPSGSITGPFFY